MDVYGSNSEVETNDLPIYLFVPSLKFLESLDLFFLGPKIFIEI